MDGSALMVSDSFMVHALMIRNRKVKVLPLPEREFNHRKRPPWRSTTPDRWPVHCPGTQSCVQAFENLKKSLMVDWVNSMPLSEDPLALASTWILGRRGAKVVQRIAQQV
jgi:hypothetical protein